MILLSAGDDSRVEEEARQGGVDRLALRARAVSELLRVALELRGGRKTVQDAHRHRG